MGRVQSLPAGGRRFFMHAFDSLLPLPVVVVLHRFGYAGRAPVALLIVVMLVASVLQQPAVQSALAGGDLQRRLFWRIGLQLGLSTTLSIYLLGWGPLMVVGYAVSALQHIRWSGSRAWGPAVCWALAGIALGQAATAAGLLYSYLTPLQTQLAGASGAILVVLLVRQYGLETAQRERAEQALHSSEQRFRALVQYSSDMTVVLDRSGTVSYVSPAVEPMLGRTPQELVGRAITDLLAPPDARAGGQWLADAPAQDQQVRHAEMRLLHADGSERWHQVTLRNLLDETAVGALVANHRDITEERRADGAK
jgi:PAS domain S-box-containing protein